MAVDLVDLVVPGLRSRADVRAVSRAILDLDVATVEVQRVQLRRS